MIAYVALTISEVAKQMGIRPSAIRYYEQIGILPPAHRVSGQRRYDVTALHRLLVIQRARQTGFKLTEIKQLFFGFRAGTPPSVRWEKLKKRKVVELDAMLEHIQNMRDLLEQQGKMPLHSTGRVWEEDVRKAVRKAAVLVNGKLHVLISTHDPQYDPHRNGESLPRRITHDLRGGKLIFLPTSL